MLAPGRVNFPAARPCIHFCRVTGWQPAGHLGDDYQDNDNRHQCYRIGSADPNQLRFDDSAKGGRCAEAHDESGADNQRALSRNGARGRRLHTTIDAQPNMPGWPSSLLTSAVKRFYFGKPPQFP